MKIPSKKIYDNLQQVLPNYSISLASEFQNNYSPFIIRIHEKGKLIPIHKDDVKYEGREYCLSNIDDQLSCILHLQEPEDGGNLIIYKKQWKRCDEKFRNIDFGYSSDLIANTKFCKILNPFNPAPHILNRSKQLISYDFSPTNTAGIFHAFSVR